MGQSCLQLYLLAGRMRTETRVPFTTKGKAKHRQSSEYGNRIPKEIRM
jgi:hypothetical protein